MPRVHDGGFFVAPFFLVFGTHVGSAASGLT